MSISKLPIVAIVGRANVGKSSLFNAVLKRREAIVAREAGTTRDSVWAIATFKGHNFWLVDTAGVKTAEDEFELTIQEQIEQAETSADAIVVVIEAHALISEEDRRVATNALKTKKPVILVVNKADQKPSAREAEYLKLGIKDIVLTSTTQNRGIEDFLNQLTTVIPRAKTKSSDKIIKVALLGRPNVGKSALFNTLGKKQQAIVADRAGTTRDVNRISVKYKGQEIMLMDTAGIRRSGKIEKGVEYFSVLRSLSAIEEADIALLLMDSSELNVQLDQRIAGMVKEANRGLVLVVSKWDKAEKDAFTRDLVAPQIAATYDFVPWAPLIFTSAITGQNVTKLFDLILEIHLEMNKQLKTSDLNRWLKSATLKHPPASTKNVQPKLNYIVQESDNPTNFKVYGSHTKQIHWSYRRYLEKDLREHFGFDGTAIRLWYFEKHLAHKHGTKPERNDRVE